MFVGHYGVSFAVKSVDRKIPLWLLFLAVQFVDILWGIFVLTGIEKVRIVPGITASSPLDLYYMPYTHSLIGSIGWSVLAAVAYGLSSRTGTSRKAAVYLGVAVFSHWILDLLVHRPDLALYDDTLKVGLGLWNYRYLAFALEMIVLFGGLLLFLRNNSDLSRRGRIGAIIFAIVMILMQGGIAFVGRPADSDKAVAISALLSYAVFAGIAFLFDKRARSS
jgi:hypothetical protein